MNNHVNKSSEPKLSVLGHDNFNHAGEQKPMVKITIAGVLLTSVVLLATVGCAPVPPLPSSTHLSQTNYEETGPSGPGSAIPAPITGLPAGVPVELTEQQFFTLVVTNVAVEEVLFALARDAGLNIDIRTNVSGSITMNVIDQPLDLILDRIAAQAGLRFLHQRNSLVVEADKPYRHTYKIDYINMDRAVTHEIAISTRVATSGAKSEGGDSGGDGDGNNSSTLLVSSANNDFWDQLIANISGFVGETSGGDGDTPNNAVIPNRVASLLTVNATQQQHREVAAYIDKLLTASHRQVLIEMTIAEVKLSHDYQVGVDWSIFNDSGWSYGSNTTGTNFADIPYAQLIYKNTTSSLGNIDLAVTLLETFGDVQVLSSPKLMALNNQTAVLKVVDELVYFTFEVERERSEIGLGRDDVTIDTTVNTVPVGLVMSVTPQISENGEITLNVRPTISRVIDYVEFDNPYLRGEDGEPSVISRVPEIQTREIETVLRVTSGQTVVLGGLMQDTINDSSQGLPWLSSLPYVGDAFKYRNDTSTKSELVIFLRPVITTSANMNTEPFSRYKQLLPDTNKPLPNYNERAKRTP
ncbi:MAG: pilus (MSHA type) biogenesis protein MshL [Gammaproteobacteria bacterium]|nr:MAG: pilus (MSHA type) biogenesis protein MshL [Gammaproteobacteria bacterium]RLA15755.1 MAG: pilus (MSHA type) biogenesis protein MshL [Gammaproteobacteria bacterium]